MMECRIFGLENAQFWGHLDMWLCFCNAKAKQQMVIAQTNQPRKSHGRITWAIHVRVMWIVCLGNKTSIMKDQLSILRVTGTQHLPPNVYQSTEMPA